MTIVVNLSPEMEERLQKKATQRGEPLEFVVTALLATTAVSHRTVSRSAVSGYALCFFSE